MNKEYKGFIIDLDGTAYVGEEPILSCVEFVNKKLKEGSKILFVTNNASASIKSQEEKLQKMGYNISCSNVLTSANVMTSYLVENNIKNIFLIGSQSFKEELEDANIKVHSNLSFDPKIEVNEVNILNNVVIGYTDKLTYSDLAIATLILNKEDSKLFATNPDMLIPRRQGLIPGNGAIVKLIEKATNKEATFIGKPYLPIINAALAKMNLKNSEVCIIGDNYDTDILAGINANIDTCFIQTGVHTIEEVNTREFAPIYSFKDLSDF